MDMRIALTGFGNVGQGLATLFRDAGASYRERYGLNLMLTLVADRGGVACDGAGLDPDALVRAKLEKGTVAAYPGGLPGATSQSLLPASNAHVLVEAASTNFEDAEPGWSYVRAALAADMDIVLASKGVLVLHYGELTEEARGRQRQVLISGTTGAPLPVVELDRRVLVGVHVESFEGIVNATTNQILTSMAGGLSYDEGVKAAQDAGVAETDPTLDVDGWDAAAKAVIIARALFGAELALHDVSRTGIQGVTAGALSDARSRGKTIKLVARVQRRDGRIEATVAPEERDVADVLGRLSGSQMGMAFTTSELGRVTCTVEQTGGIPTALTVIRDLVNLARDRGWTAEQ